MAQIKKKRGKSKRKSSVTRRNLLFLDYYIETDNLSQSWVKAGYSEKGACKGAREALKKPHIWQAYQDRLKEIGDKSDITAQDVINELGKIAFANSEDYFDWVEDEIQLGEETKKIGRILLKPPEEISREAKAAISGFKETQTGFQIQFHSKTVALESLKKYFGADNDAEISKAKNIKQDEKAQEVEDPLKDKTIAEIEAEIEKLE